MAELVGLASSLAALDELTQGEETCLNVHRHSTISNYVLHYFGCLRFEERQEFFAKNNLFWIVQAAMRSIDGETNPKAEEAVETTRQSWEQVCQHELQRVELLRQSLTNDPDENHFVKSLAESRMRYLSSLRGSHRTGLCGPSSIPEMASRRTNPPKNDPHDTRAFVDASLMYFHGPRGTDTGFKGSDLRMEGTVRGTFPNQTMTLDKLLGIGVDSYRLPPRDLFCGPQLFDGPPSSRESIRYFRIPFNNLSWAESTIYNYFSTAYEPTIYDEQTYFLYQRHWRRRAKNITIKLSWKTPTRDTQHEKPYLRRLRPWSMTTAPGSGTGDNPAQDVIVSMPYVHWETFSKKRRYDSNVKEASSGYNDRERHKIEGGSSFPRSRHSPKRDAAPVSKDGGTSKPDLGPSSAGSRLAAFLERLNRPHASLQVDEKGRVFVPNPLGQYLVDAARLFQAMSEYRQKEIIRKCIKSPVPLEPRRTLEQSYHWTLKDGEDRSENQVLYRATKARAFHLHNPQAQSLPERSLVLAGNCEICKEDSRKVPSVVMVDQLWMWILDSTTIITCFPDQYGSSVHDSFGVENSIKARLQIGNRQISSVFDLGLIIIDECSNAIFDRAKVTGGQPELVDVFSAKLGRIRNRQQVLFKRFWQWATEIEKKIQADGSSADIEVPLDLFTEGMLIRELKDMIEELDIMIYTMKTQKEVLQTYIANAERTLDPLNIYRSNMQRIYVSRHRKWNALTGKLDNIESEEEEQRAAEENKFYQFRSHAEECSAKLRARLESLEGLREAANAGVESVKDLLELKGQQASLIQAWRSSIQSEETVHQGRVILVFTLVTIVFLPLSFMSSIFGMNNVEFDSGSWPIRDEIVYMVAVSVSVIVVSLGLAFNAWLRSGIWYAYKVVTTRFLVSTGLYGLWRRFGIPAEALDTRGRRTARDLFRDAAAAVKEKPPPDPIAAPPAKDTATLTGMVAELWRRMHSRNLDPESGGTART